MLNEQSRHLTAVFDGVLVMEMLVEGAWRLKENCATCPFMPDASALVGLLSGE